MGSIGVSLNGVAFNQYAGPNNQPLTNEINSFDQYVVTHKTQGLPLHLEPVFLTANAGQEALMGFLLDGFPVYGPMEDGMMVEESDLDAFHGHEHATDDFPDGIYHYHITDRIRILAEVDTMAHPVRLLFSALLLLGACTESAVKLPQPEVDQPWVWADTADIVTHRGLTTLEGEILSAFVLETYPNLKTPLR